MKIIIDLITEKIIKLSINIFKNKQRMLLNPFQIWFDITWSLTEDLQFNKPMLTRWENLVNKEVF